MNAPASHLSRAEKRLLVLTAAGAVGVGGLGLASSVDAVSDAAREWGFSAPWMLPAAIDVAIPVFTLANLLLIRLGMAVAWVRFVPWALTAVTCWLNIAAGDSAAARVAHGTMPLLWVVLSEIAAHVYAVRIGVATGRRMERVRRSRWLLAPRSTFALWRRMVLWEITDYREALNRERQRQLARADLRERYGRRWRRHAPRRTRVLLKLGDLDPDGTPEAESQPEAAETPEPTELRPTPRRRARKSAIRRRRSADELLSEARSATADWSDEALTADAIRQAVRTSQANARSLRDTLRAERRDRQPATAAPAAS